jgi:hypothetical protein
MLRVLLLVVVLVLLVVLGVLAFFFFQLRANKRLRAEQAGLDDSAWGICTKCQQRRLIVSKDAGLCAFCWSSMRTKPLN